MLEVIGKLYGRLLERDYAQDDPKVVMLTPALANILGHDNCGDTTMEVLLRAAWGEQGVVDRPSMCVLILRNGALSSSESAHKLGLGTARTHQPG